MSFGPKKHCFCFPSLILLPLRFEKFFVSQFHLSHSMAFFGDFLRTTFRLRRLPIIVVVIFSMQTRSVSFNGGSQAIKLPCSSGYDTCIASILFVARKSSTPPHYCFRQQSSNSVMEYHIENISGRWFIDGHGESYRRTDTFRVRIRIVLSVSRSS